MSCDLLFFFQAKSVSDLEREFHNISLGSDVSFVLSSTYFDPLIIIAEVLKHFSLWSIEVTAVGGKDGTRLENIITAVYIS